MFPQKNYSDTPDKFLDLQINVKCSLRLCQTKKNRL